MENTRMNPLIQYNRRPARYVKLPSMGKCYLKGIDLTDTNEVAIYPMTAKDELLLKSPDALLNGESIKQVFKACVPGIVDPNEIPIIDMDAIMVGIRMATYGDNMELEFSHDCEADAVTQVNVNLGNILDSTTFYDGDVEVVLPGSGMRVFVKPYTLVEQNKVNIAGFEEMAKSQQVEAEVKEQLQKLKMAGKSFTRLLDATLDLITASIDKVITPDNQEFTDRKIIREWVTTISKPEFDLIDRALKNITDVGVESTITVKCAKCGQDYDADLTFNPSDFFG
jgi:hypothetical protein